MEIKEPPVLRGAVRAYTDTKVRFSPTRKYRVITDKLLASALTTSLYLHEKSRLRPLYYSTGSSLMGEKPNVDSNGWIQVPTLNLVNFIRDLGRVKILRIDIKGYETLLIPAILASGVVAQIDFILIETHDCKWEGLANLSEEMKRLVAASPFRDKFYFDGP